MKTRMIRISTLLLFCAISASCTTWRIVRYNFSGIEDHEIFPARELPASEEPSLYARDEHSGRAPETILFKDRRRQLDRFLEQLDTIAFLVIRNDTIIHERYFDQYSESSISTVFSITKSYMSMLIGCAIQDGTIGSVEDAVTDYIPEMSGNGFDKVRIKHLLQMTSGIKYSKYEDQPFGKPATFYYTKDLRKEVLKLRLRREPCEPFSYRSGNTQILALVLERALGGQTITDYLVRRVWGPAGMEFKGSWSTDREDDGMERAYSSLNATARDIAKIGSVYLHNGRWKGRQIVPEDWVEASTKVDTTECSAPFYQYGWWIMSAEYGDYRAEGAHGQYLYINPALNTVIVRLGRGMGGLSWKEWKELLILIAEESH